MRKRKKGDIEKEGREEEWKRKWEETGSGQ